jgi:hypothetical protein
LRKYGKESVGYEFSDWLVGNGHVRRLFVNRAMPAAVAVRTD